MRDTSVSYQDLKKRPLRDDVPWAGAENLNKRFSRHTNQFKDDLFEDLVGRGQNIIIPDTAAQEGFGRGLFGGRAHRYLQTLVKAEYDIVMTAVYMNKDMCEKSGASREKQEGKKYSSGAWTASIRAIPILFSQCRELTNNTHSYFILDNSYGPTFHQPPDSIEVTAGVPLSYTLLDNKIPIWTVGKIKHTPQTHPPGRSTRVVVEQGLLKLRF